MSVTVARDAEIVREANRILMEHFSPAKLVRLWAGWQAGNGDYLAWRDDVFGEATVAALYEEIEAYQAAAKISPPV